ncbi:cupin domain-containing protein [Shimia ponticola]|uniref:cupin domain-containing protein n=1 Tax=Shimia ponticola TaxID=2582893 RepID=UPI0011BF16FB|nr:cupin domain-containing protein [Shimia ponticola]
MPNELRHIPATTIGVQIGQGGLGPADYFTGAVSPERLSGAEDMPASALRVSFAPGARTNWHTHDDGQILIVTSGNGIVADRDGWIRHITTGDVVEIPGGVEHWHGALANGPMQHIAIQTASATWLEPVTEEDYAASQPT